MIFVSAWGLAGRAGFLGCCPAAAPTHCAAAHAYRSGARVGAQRVTRSPVLEFLHSARMWSAAVLVRLPLMMRGGDASEQSPNQSVSAQWGVFDSRMYKLESG